MGGEAVEGVKKIAAVHLRWTAVLFTSTLANKRVSRPLISYFALSKRGRAAWRVFSMAARQNWRDASCPMCLGFQTGGKGLCCG